MLKYSILDVTPKDYDKSLRDKASYIRELKKVKVPKISYQWSNHKSLVRNERQYYKGYYSKQYQFVIHMPKSHILLMQGKYFNSKDEKQKTFKFNAGPTKPTMKLIKGYYDVYKREIQQLRASKKNFTYNNHSKLMSKFIGNSSDSIGILTNTFQNRIGLVYHKPGMFSALAEVTRLKKWFKNKSPLTEENHIGVEIEGILVGIDRNKFAKLLHEKTPELINNVTVKDDGSIHGWESNGDEHPVELCIIDEETKIGETIKKVLSFALQYKFKVNDTCGLHVHLDMRNRDAKKSFANLYSFQNFLYKLTSYKRKQNTFCKPIKVKNVDNYFDFRQYALSGRGNARYKGINANALRQHKTIEIRLHAGTTDVERIESWINLLVKIVNADNVPKKVSTSAKKLKELLQLDEKLLNYVKKYSKIEKDARLGTSEPRISWRAQATSGYYTVSTVTVNNDNNEEIPF